MLEINTVKLGTEGGYIINGTSFVPDDPGNRHYKAVQKWIAAGNTPDPADVPQPLPPPVWEDLARVILEAPVVLPPQASQQAKDALARLQAMIGG